MAPNGANQATASLEHDPILAETPKTLTTTSDMPARSGNPFASLKSAKRANSGRLPHETTNKKLKRPDQRNGPDWYAQIKPNAKFNRTLAFKLTDVIDYLQLVKSTTGDPAKLARLFSQLRKSMHTIEYDSDLSPAAVKHSKILEDRGLPLIIRNGIDHVNFPWDLKANAEALARKWSNIYGIDPSIDLGIVLKDGRYSFDKKYAGKKPCNVFGDNGLINGQWWPFQIGAAIHGAHGSLRGGIHHSTEGAYSIMISHGPYPDQDNGDDILYFGSFPGPDSPSDATKAMLKSMNEGLNVRVLRSSTDKPCNNPHLPVEGIRYDGLYRINSFDEAPVRGVAIHRFFMTRVPGQKPIRFQGVEKRPTDEEIRRLKMLRKARKPSA